MGHRRRPVRKRVFHRHGSTTVVKGQVTPTRVAASVLTLGLIRPRRTIRRSRRVTMTETRWR
jgi:hypothetical protein